MCRNLRQALAPSIEAASYCSASIALRPATIRMMKNGRPDQMFTRMTDGKAVVGSPSQGNPWTGRRGR